MRKKKKQAKNLFRHSIGKYGEKLAERHLFSKGFRILRRNYRTPFGEIDIVSTYGKYLVFLEVKTRISEKFGTPFSSITRTKQKHIIRNCQYYIKRHRIFNRPCRIDAVSVKLDINKNLQVLDHVTNVIEIEEN